MDLTSSSLGSKEALSCTNNAFMNIMPHVHVVNCILECVKCMNKLRVYRELKEHFECKKYLRGVCDMGS